MEKHKEIEITNIIYQGYSSGYGVLFGIPAQHRKAVETIVKIVLRIINDKVI